MPQLQNYPKSFTIHGVRDAMQDMVHLDHCYSCTKYNWEQTATEIEKLD